MGFINHSDERNLAAIQQCEDLRLSGRQFVSGRQKIVISLRAGQRSAVDLPL